jgi:hypothetical protein
VALGTTERDRITCLQPQRHTSARKLWVGCVVYLWLNAIVRRAGDQISGQGSTAPAASAPRRAKIFRARRQAVCLLRRPPLASCCLLRHKLPRLYLSTHVDRGAAPRGPGGLPFFHVVPLNRRAPRQQHGPDNGSLGCIVHSANRATCMSEVSSSAT